MKLKNYSRGDIYKSQLIKFFCWYLLSLLIFENGLFPFYKIKKKILIFFGAKIGKNFVIKPNVKIKFPWNLVVYDNVSIGEKVWIDNLDFVEIHDDCCISQGVYLCTGNHNYKSKKFELFTKKIVIYSSVWVGAYSIVLPGSIIHNDVVITAGSVVNGSVTSNSIYAGNPAKFLKYREYEDN